MDETSVRYFLRKSFEIKCTMIQPVKAGVYRLTTEDGRVYGLKKMKFKRARLAWMDHALAAIKRRGFAAYAWGPWRYPLSAQYPYVLTEWCEGSTADATNSEDLRLCARTLAEFHLAGATKDVRGPGELVTLGTWQQRFQLGHTWLEQAWREKWSVMRGQFILAKEYPQLRERAETALAILRKQHDVGYKRVMDGVLCHGDSGPANFIVKQTEVKMIDFETLRIDAPSYDLFRMIRLAGKRNGWSVDSLQSILHGYAGVHALTSEDIQLLRAWLTYPYKVCKLLGEYAHVKGQQRTMIEEKIARAIKKERELPSLLQHLMMMR